MKSPRIRSPDAAWPRGRRGLRYQRWKSHPHHFINEKKDVTAHLWSPGVSDHLSRLLLCRKGQPLNRKEREGGLSPWEQPPWVLTWALGGPQSSTCPQILGGCQDWPIPLQQIKILALFLTSKLLFPPHLWCCFSLLPGHVVSCSVVFDSLWPHGL